MVNLSRLNELFSGIKMGAMVRPLIMEHFVARPYARISSFARALACLGACACAGDDVVPVAKPAVAAQAPIVDLSPSAQKPVIAVETPALAVEPAARAEPRPVPAPGASVIGSGDVAALRGKRLVIPVAGVRAANLVGSFRDPRGGRVHEALDIAAPRGTAVLSADDGTVLKLFTSRGGGLTIYAADPTKQFIYYYAHLDAYAPSLAEGQPVTKGQQIGTVGTTGNAPPNTPHLHFAILKNPDMKRWWTGTAIDPYSILRPTAAP